VLTICWYQLKKYMLMIDDICIWLLYVITEMISGRFQNQYQTVISYFDDFVCGNNKNPLLDYYLNLIIGKISIWYQNMETNRI
jgi:hypothetical protein